MAWSNPSEKVNLGGGAFFLNAGYTPFRLSLRGHLPVPALVTNRVPGFRLVSGTVGRPVAVDSLLGFPPKDGDTVYQFTNGTYAVHSFQFGQWDGGTPMLRVDESAFLFLVP